jgi:hypothetical protein
MTAAWRDQISNTAALVFDGARAAVFLPARNVREPASPAVAAYLVLLDVAALIALGRAAESAPVVFDPGGFQGILVQVGVLAFAAAVLSALAQRDRRLLPVFCLALSASLVIDVVWNGLWLWSATGPWVDAHLPQSFALWDVSQGWLGLVLAIALVRPQNTALTRALIFVTALVVVAGPLLFIDRGAGFWSEPPQASNDGPPGVVVSEELLYGENARLDAALEAVLERTPGRINVYFVGFAGNGAQAVFMKEIIFVKDLFEKRFGALGHSVALINNVATAASIPLATVTSLHDTLIEVGKRMSNEDILVLYVTSHGSAETGVNVSLDPFRFEDLDPATLREMLDEAHIRQRVVIVSACYSGIFVDALKGPETLVITAADGSHTSFGCSNEADFTYFGRAYFAEGLARTSSLPDAFAIAAPLIAKREDAEGFVHSNPQMALGAMIEKSLEKLEVQLKARQH